MTSAHHQVPRGEDNDSFPAPLGRNIHDSAICIGLTAVDGCKEAIVLSFPCTDTGHLSSSETKSQQSNGAATQIKLNEQPSHGYDK